MKKDMKVHHILILKDPVHTNGRRVVESKKQGVFVQMLDRYKGGDDPQKHQGGEHGSQGTI